VREGLPFEARALLDHGQVDPVRYALHVGDHGDQFRRSSGDAFHPVVAGFGEQVDQPLEAEVGQQCRVGVGHGVAEHRERFDDRDLPGVGEQPGPLGDHLAAQVAFGAGVVGEAFGPATEVDVAVHDGEIVLLPGNLFPEPLNRRRHDQSLSMMVALAMPLPSHMVCRP
jgi:hypothetical protein